MLSKYSQVAAALTASTLLIGISHPFAVQAQMTPLADTETQLPTARGRLMASGSGSNETVSYQTLYVNPTVGSDSANGLETAPLRTVTRALEVAPPNTVIVLAPGRYTQGSGEVFPLQLKPGVTIQGTPGERERAAIIEGGGRFTSPTRSQQNATILAADRAGLAQVAISNPDGYGVWIESASPTILESAFVGNRQTGIYVAGGSPRVQGSYFSGNQVAGLIVFGVSSAHIQRNTFDGTGDAIRVIDGATPEIVGNRITNNDAGVVLIGNARPVLRDNQIVGNRRDDVVAVSARPRDIESSRAVALAAEDEVSKIAEPADSVTAAATEFRSSRERVEVAVIAPSTELRETTEARESLAADNLAENMPSADNDLPDATVASRDVLPAGSPGAALQALQSGLAIRPRAVTEENPDSPGSLLRNRRRRREENIRPTEARPALPRNNNRLAVPNTSIPIGSGSSATIFSPPTAGGGAPPAPPSRAQALGLYYRVFVEASDPFEQDSVREVVPDAFRTRFEGRTVMQVGAFPTEREAEERRELLEDNNFDVRVEYIR
ncbi:MAG: DUF1565 domain-containing protein [Cyanobacteria bacterium J06632_3]